MQADCPLMVPPLLGLTLPVLVWTTSLVVVVVIGVTVAEARTLVEDASLFLATHFLLLVDLRTRLLLRTF